MSPTSVSFGLILVAGLVSFLSPCVLSLVPVYPGSLGRAAAAPAGGAVTARRGAFSHGWAFVLGLSEVR